MSETPQIFRRIVRKRGEPPKARVPKASKPIEEEVQVNEPEAVLTPELNLVAALPLKESRIFLKTKMLFLTYPGHIDAEGYLAWIRAKIPKNTTLTHYAIAHEVGYDDMEKHPEGYAHTHMSLQFDRPYQVSTARTLDYHGVHGDYLRTKSIVASHRYLAKGDIDIELCRAEGIDYTKKETKAKPFPRKPPVLFTNVTDLEQYTTQAQQNQEMVDLVEYLKTCKTLDQALEHEMNTDPSTTNNILKLWGELNNSCDYSDGYHMRKALTIELYPWQQMIYDQLVPDNTDDRLVTWIYNRKGNIGKSTLVDVVHNKLPGVLVLSDTARTNDMALVLAEYCKRVGESPKILLFDLARSRADNHSMYTFLEQVKNGHILSAKYKSMQLAIKPPHVIVFANFFPDLKGFSADRWNIIDIKNSLNGIGHDVIHIPTDHFGSALKKDQMAHHMEQRRIAKIISDQHQRRIDDLLNEGFTQEEIDEYLDQDTLLES